MEIIQSSWKEQLVIGVDSIVLKDGTVYTIEIDAEKDIRAKETFNTIYTFRVSEKTTVNLLLENDPDIWSEIQVYGELHLSDNSRILFGEGEMGNEGFIAKLDVNNNLEWSMFSTESNPFVKSKQENGKTHIFSSHGFSVILNEDYDPLRILVDNHMDYLDN